VRGDQARLSHIEKKGRTRRDLSSSILQNILQRLPRLSVSSERGTALGLDFQAPITSLILGKIHEMQRGMGLVGAQHYIRVQMSRVVISVIQSEIALRIKDGGLAEIGIEACPNERAEAPEKVGQVGWRRFGLMRLHASKAVCNTR
jgi:hypothetical protein